MSDTRTTQDLRTTLLDCIDRVANGTLEPKAAREISVLSSRVIDTARLELEHSRTLSTLDKDGQSVNTGPIMLAERKGESA